MATEHTDSAETPTRKRQLANFSTGNVKTRKLSKHRLPCADNSDLNHTNEVTINWKKAKAEIARKIDLAIAAPELPDRYQRFYQIINDQIAIYERIPSKRKAERRKAVRLAELAFKVGFAQFENLLANESNKTGSKWSSERSCDYVHYMGSLCSLCARISLSPRHQSRALQAQELFARNAKTGDKRAFAMFSHLALHMNDPLTALVCALRMLKFGESKRGHSDAENAMRALARDVNSWPAAVPAILSSIAPLEIQLPQAGFRAPPLEPPLMIFKLVVLATLMENIYNSHSAAANQAVMPLVREFLGAATRSQALSEADLVWTAVYSGIESDVDEFVSLIAGSGGLLVAK